MAGRNEESEAFFLPASYALLLLDAIRPWNVTAADLFDPLGIEQNDLDAPNARLPLATIASVIRRARTLTDEPGLGILLGLRTQPNAFGYLSFATMSASTLGEAIDLMIRFSSVVTLIWRYRLNRVDGVASLVVDELCEPNDVRDVLLLGLLVGIRSIGCALTGREPWRPIDVAMPEPPYYRRLAHLVPELRFSQPVNQIVLAESDLELPLLTPNRAALRLAAAQCEVGLRQIVGAVGVDDLALDVMQRADEALPLPAVAAALGLSPRTLRRRLAESGATFSELAEKARCERALLLLRARDVSLEHVAERLGYSTLPNFVRAFRRWTGVTPASYRKTAGDRLPVHLPLRR